MHTWPLAVVFVAAGLASAFVVAGLCAALERGGSLGGMRRLQLIARLRARQARVAARADLPFFLDLIVICLESGTTMAAAIEQAVRIGPDGALRRQFAEVLTELRAGRTFREALTEFGARSQAGEFESFASACVTAQLYGSDLADVLRDLAAQVREQLFLDAEQQALRAPVKMIAPLVLCIFPGTFVVLAFPIVARLIRDGVL